MQMQQLDYIGFINMSSYLTFYIVPKAENSKPLALISYSRNSGIYRSFYDSIHPAYTGMEDEIQYTELTKDKVDQVIFDLQEDINSAKRRLAEYEKHAAGNTEIIEDIIEQREYIDNLEYGLHKIEFIKDLVIDAGYGCTGFTKVLCNVD